MNEIVKSGNIINSLDDAERAAKLMAASGFFEDAKSAGQALVKILAGMELGFGPFASMTGVAIIKGKPVIGANLQAVALKRSGKYNYRVLENTNTAVEIEFYESGKPVGKSRFTLEDSAAAELSGREIWKKFPRNMLFARALSNGIKWYAPDIFNGFPVYTPDELGASEDGDGNIIDAPAMVVTTPAPAQEPQQAASDVMTLEQARAMTGANGEMYGNRPTDELVHISNNNKAPAEKRQAARLIILSRNEEK